MSEESRLAIAIDSKGAERNLRSVRNELNGVEKQGVVSAAALKKMALGLAAGATAASAAFTLLAKDGLAYVDAQAKMADQLGSTIDGLRGLQIAANDAGIDTSTLNSAVDRLNSRLGEARLGSGQAAEALGRMGLSADALANMDADERIATLADRVQGLGLDSADTANLLRDLGIRNREMVNLLRAGGDGIRQARQEVDDYGLSLSRVDAARVEQANDALSRIPRIMEPIKNQIAINLAQPLNDVADLFNDAARESQGFAGTVVDSMEWAARGVAELLDTVDAVRIGLMQAQRVQLQAEALGANIRATVLGTEGPTPQQQALEAFDAELSQLTDGNSNVARVADYFEELAPTFRRNFEARQRELNGLVDTSGALALFGDSARASAQVVEEAAQTHRAALEGVVPTTSQTAVPERASTPSAGLNLSSITPMSADQFPTGGVASDAPSAIPTPKSRGSVHVTVTDKNGTDTSGVVEGDDAFVTRLADALSDAASAVSGR
ncbi:hypothetical protein [Halomonas urumqiensis]|uniref:Uncharacterized protein n=1 Tax=Halomonas urumqiensis TaxID=1684789 RepID=A0A2N7UF85_9GAMM|nr:hypothetical protein [Halomonas urumqiensis]PMR79102.1 hypothetical protein C1H70_12400 [Halomonas urumqiensis]PTB03776.1 hypothetical protein C6V82_04685 [Halomonas urumqiensis]GHE19997.1 hypothetical protein GCM10017767_05180 [Halomonas urumqiensis]